MPKNVVSPALSFLLFMISLHSSVWKNDGNTAYDFPFCFLLRFRCLLFGVHANHPLPSSKPLRRLSTPELSPSGRLHTPHLASSRRHPTPNLSPSRRLPAPELSPSRRLSTPRLFFLVLLPCSFTLYLPAIRDYFVGFHSIILWYAYFCL